MLQKERRAESLGLSLDELEGDILAVREGVQGEAGSREEAIRVSKQKEKADREATAAASEHERAMAELGGRAADASGEIDDNTFPGYLGDADAAARQITQVVRDALTNGSILTGWNSAR